jgi:hypothetical protein
MQAPADPQEILRDRDAEIAKIQGYADLTQEPKDRRIAAVHEWAQREYAEAREAERERIQQRLESTKQAVFQVPGGYMSSDAEQAQIMAAFRSAWKDVLSATEVDEGSLLPELQQRQGEQKLTPILEQTERTGDFLLARAVYHRAIDLGAQGIVDKYLSTRKSEATAWQRYTEATQEAEQATSFEGLYAGVMMDQQFAS